jgi:hypothetical protein
MSGEEDGSAGNAAPAGSVRSEGGNVLVVGDAPAGVHRTACRELHGGTDGDDRHLLVLSGRDAAHAGQYLPEESPRDREHLRVVDHDVSTRSAAADGGHSNGTKGLEEGVVSQVSGDDLAGLGATTSEQVDAFEAITGGLDPGELRACLDSLGALVAEHGDTEVFGFLHILTERLRRADAAAYFHLPVAPDDRLAGMFESMFDYTVAVRLADGAVQVRWDDGEWRPVDAGD